jgi:hypothetical protein
MENPYAAPELTPELAKEERRRPKMWRALLVAYGMHHGFSVLGMFVGVLVEPNEFSRFFPPDEPLLCLLQIVLIPVTDLFLVIEPLTVGEIVPAIMVGIRWLRTLLVLSIPVAGLVYALSKRRAALWYVGIVSFVVHMSYVLTMALDRRAA